MLSVLSKIDLESEKSYLAELFKKYHFSKMISPLNNRK
jgi:hypothetical protein